MTERSSKTLTPQYSRSPKPRDNISPHQLESESPEMTYEYSSDESDEDNRYHDNSFDLDAENYSEHQETPRQHKSPRNRLNTPKSNADSDIRLSHRKSPGNCDPDGAKQPLTPPQYSRRKSIETKTNLSSEKYPWWAFLALIGFVIAVIYSLYSTAENLQTVQENPSAESPFLEEARKFKETISEIKSTFPGQNRRTWSDIESGVIEIIKGSEKPWIFVLYSNETKEISCLAKMLGKASSKALHSEESLELFAHDMGDDYGLAIERLKPKINATKAVVVYDVLKIKPGAIQAFHTMCDRENPLVESTVYILTIITSGNIPRFEKPIRFVENQLTNRFINKVPEDKLQPLITRLTDGSIIPVEPEIGFSECPL